MKRETLEEKVERLELEVMELRSRMESLTAPVSPGAVATPRPPAEEVDAGEEIVQWMGKSSFLPRVSAVCFLLVVALVLRTVTDNRLLDQQVGSLVGMAYATVLIFIGGYKYGRSSPLAPVFAVGGGVLMYAIVLETHAHFESLPSVPAYIFLALTGIGMASISYLYQSALPVLVGSLGMGVAAIGIDYPNPYYPHLVVVLLIANLLGAFATRLRRCSWLRWILLLVTVTVLLVWGVKLSIRLGSDYGAAVEYGLSWYFPVILVFALTFTATALTAIFRKGGEWVTRFDLALPSVTGLWVVPSAILLVRAGHGSSAAVGLAGAAAAVLLFCTAWALVRSRGSEATGVTALVTASTVWLALSVAPAFGTLAVALPVLSLAAVGLAFVSDVWTRGSVRGLSYLLQVGACTFLIAAVLDNPPGETILLQALGGGSVGMIALVHYLWCRRRTPAADSRLFGQWDREDRSAVLLLMAALAGQYVLMRSGIWLLASRSSNPVFVFQAGQSILINLAAAGLVLLSFSRRNREVRNLGIILVLVGAGRVFLGDLPGISGVPLVGSVFSFGMAVSLVSVALTRWERSPSGSVGKGEGGEVSGCGKCA